jgi:transcriptional regulator
VDDPPPGFIEQQLRAIVGVEIEVERVEAKRKLSQNRGEADRRGAISGLEAEDDARSAAVAAAIRGALP